jgi:streptogramin lyase
MRRFRCNLSVTLFTFFFIFLIFPKSEIKAQSAPAFTELTSPITYPYNLTVGSDGKLWISDDGYKVGRMDLSGEGRTMYFLPNQFQSSYYGRLQITSGPDGNMWFTMPEANKIGKITTQGVITEYSMRNADSLPAGITSGSDGYLWFTMQGTYKIGRLTPSTGNTVEFHYRTEESLPSQDIVQGSDGNFWYTQCNNRIGKITPTGTMTEYSYSTNRLAGDCSYGVAKGPDGNIWFAGHFRGTISKVTPSGQFTHYYLNDERTYPYKIVAGSDGNLWFTELNHFWYGESGISKIGRITPSGQVTEYSIPGNSDATDIVSAPDGNLYVTIPWRNSIIRINPKGEEVTSVPMFKQTSDPWQSKIYDTATNWSPNTPTIKTWGCALSSATMLLSYHGIKKMPNGNTLDPGELNNWLINNNGYSKNGDVLFYQIPKLYKDALQVNGITNYKIMEFEKVNGKNVDRLKNELTAKHPTILALDGGEHFVVATEASGDTFKINDPYHNISLLSDSKYKNDFTGLRVLYPHNSDASYLVVESHPEILVKIIDINGNVVSETYLEGPIIDPENPDNKNKQTRFTHVVKPETNNYNILITNPKSISTELIIYNYNSDADVAISSQEVSSGKSSFLVHFDKSDTTNFKVEKSISYESIISQLEIFEKDKSVNRGVATAMTSILKISKKEFEKGKINNAIKLIDTVYQILKNGNKRELLVKNTAFKILTEDLNQLKLTILII